MDEFKKNKNKKNMVLMLGVEFKTKLGFNPFDPIKGKEQSVVTKWKYFQAKKNCYNAMF